MEMDVLRLRKQMLAFFAAGFVFGVVCANAAARIYHMESGVFGGRVLFGFQASGIEYGRYCAYILRLRAVPVLVLYAASRTKMRKAAAVLFLIWTGISAGILVSSAALGLGISGSVLCVAGIFPQFLFYIPAFFVLLQYCFAWPAVQWSRQKMIFTVLMTGAGIVLEVYVNPLVMQFLALYI